MGGKTWQEVEERLFWQVLVPQSPEALDPADRKYSWGDISAIMKEELGHLHFRKYTCQLIYEHFYQNFRGERLSPKARNYVNEWRRLKELAPLGRATISAESCGKVASVSSETHRWSPSKPPSRTTSPRTDTEVVLDAGRLSSRSDTSFRERQGSPLRHVGSIHPQSAIPVDVTQDKRVSYARAPVPYYHPVAEAQRMSPPLRSKLPSDSVAREYRYHNEQRAPPPVSLPPIHSFYFPPRHEHLLTLQQPDAFTLESRQRECSGMAAPPQTPELLRPGPTDLQEIPAGETNKNMSSAPNGSQTHGALFEALLLATSLSSSEPSPSESSNGRSSSVSSVTTIVETSNDDNSSPGVGPVGKNDQSL